MKIDFVKLTNKWFADIVNWSGSVMDLEMVCGADKLLDEISKGHRHVSLIVSPDEIDTEEKYVYNLIKVDNDGGTYRNIEGNQIWICNVTVTVFGEFPEKIWIKSA